MNEQLCVQFGCGWCAPESWQNFDASPTLRFERIPVLGKLYTRNETRFPSNVRFGDIVQGLPIADNSADFVYCSHVLEHLALLDFRKALENTLKMLKPGGTFRFVLPDLAEMIRTYHGDDPEKAAIAFMRASMLGIEARPRSVRAFTKDWLGGSKHLWMWDYDGIRSELGNIGFTGIRRAQFKDSAHPVFAAVEDEGRWTKCLGVACQKPTG